MEPRASCRLALYHPRYVPSLTPTFFFKNVSYLQESAKYIGVVWVLSLPNVYMLRVINRLALREEAASLALRQRGS